MAEFIVAATCEVFSTMLGQELVPEKPILDTGANSPASGIVSLVGLAGAWTGTGGIACSSSLACKLSSMFLMAEYDSVNEDVLDAIAEITNMVIGNVKTALEEKVGAMGLSVPTVIFGQNFQTRNAGSNEWVVVPFVVGEERMHIQLCLAVSKDSATKTTKAGFLLPHLVNL